MCKKITSSIVSSKLLFFLITTLFLLALNLTPMILQARHSPPGRTFALLHNNAQDFFFYQSLMNEGAHGAWLISDPYTTEVHNPSVIFAYFAWMGKVSSLLSLPFAYTYHAVRIIFGFLLFAAAFYLINHLKIPYPRLTYLFFLFAAPFMHTKLDGGKLITVPFMNFWTGIDPIRRAAYLPHHMVGNFLLVVSIILIIKYVNNNSKFQVKSKNLILLLLLVISVVMAFVHTPSLFIILLMFPPAFLVYFLSVIPDLIRDPYILNLDSRVRGNDRKKISNLLITQFLNHRIIGLLGYWVIGLLFLALMVSQSKNGFPWSQYITWERNLQFPLNRELIGGFGILFPFALVGMLKALLSRKIELILIASWFAVPLLLIPFASKLGISNIRLIQGVPFLPMSILSIWGISIFNDLLIKILNPLKSKSKMQKSKTQIKIQRLFGLLFASTGDTGGRDPDSAQATIGAEHWREGQPGAGPVVGNLIIGLFLIIFIAFTYPTLTWSMKDQIREYWAIFGNVYFDRSLLPAVKYINNNFPPRTHTLSTFYTGNYLPSFTNTVSFIGHFGYTYNVDQKEKMAAKFFENKMSDSEVKSLLLNNKITLVVQGFEEKPIYGGILYPNILKKIYDAGGITLYKPNF